MPATGILRGILSLCLGAALLLGGCSAPLRSSASPNGVAQQRYEELVDPGEQYAFEVYDPLERVNRATYRFNYYFDNYLFLPVVRAYEAILPDYAEDRISDFKDNVYEIRNVSNNLLQLEYKAAGESLLRFLVNSTVGVAGFWDRATDLGLPPRREDLGQTLGKYSMGEGPYLVLPVLGPSNSRDLLGTGGDMATFYFVGPPAWVDNGTASTTFGAVSAVDERHRQPFRYHETGSPFEYELIRMFYTQKRQVEIQR